MDIKTDVLKSTIQGLDYRSSPCSAIIGQTFLVYVVSASGVIYTLADVFIPGSTSGIASSTEPSNIVFKSRLCKILPIRIVFLFP